MCIVYGQIRFFFFYSKVHPWGQSLYNIVNERCCYCYTETKEKVSMHCPKKEAYIIL